MTQDQKRIKIAEACGFEKSSGVSLEEGYLWRKGNTAFAQLPDYFNDLNAMHEAEKILWPMEPVFLSAYCELLMKSRYPSDWGSAWSYIHATAAQRAEAFGLTLGLWDSQQ